MMPAWLVLDILWLSLALLLVSALMRMRLISALGWALFGVYWIHQPWHYVDIGDYFNAALMVAAAAACVYVAWVVISRGCSSKACSWAGYAAAVCGMIYFPFSELPILRDWLIGQTTLVTYDFLRAFSVPASLDGWNVLSLNGMRVEIILACTALESMALFAGIILSVRAPLGRRIATIIVSTGSIYFLNIIRNAFVLLAFGEHWFGDESFFIAHNVIAKAGSIIALLAIAYFVFMAMPELLAAIDDLASEMKRPRGDAA
jgi:archaeosortase A (PGF-CTERM-specific)